MSHRHDAVTKHKLEGEQLIAAIDKQAEVDPYSPPYLMMDMRALNA